MTRFVARLVAGQLLGLAVLAGVAVRWPHTAAQATTGLRTFAFAVGGLALAALVALAVPVVRSIRQPPYGGE